MKKLIISFVDFLDVIVKSGIFFIQLFLLAIIMIIYQIILFFQNIIKQIANIFKKGKKNHE